MQYDMSNLLKSCKILCNFSIPVWYKSKYIKHKDCIKTIKVNVSEHPQPTLAQPML